MPRPRTRAAGLFALVILAASTLRAQQTPLWTVSQPYPNNPLRRASTSGSMAFAGDTRTVEFEIECRAPQLARINLRFPAHTLKFNLDPFEGPPGIGQKRKLLTIQLNNTAAIPHRFSGFYVESETFVFAIAPARATMASLVSRAAAGQQLTISVSPADGRGDPLTFHFTLPADNQPALDVAKPCNNSKAKDREPDPQ